jgi:hypothetical protein
MGGRKPTRGNRETRFRECDSDHECRREGESERGGMGYMTFIMQVGSNIPTYLQDPT